MEYIDKYTYLNYLACKKDIAFGTTRMKRKSLFQKGDRYYVLVDMDEEKMILLAKDNDHKHVYPGTDCEYFVQANLYGPKGEPRIIALYSIKHQKLLDVSNYRLMKLYRQIFLTGNSFELKYPLSEINSEELGVVPEEERKAYQEYLTSGNKAISHDDIVAHILTKYPKLENYTNLKRGLTLAEYEAIAEKVGGKKLYISPIKQDLEFLQDDESLDPSERRIYLPESEQQQRIITYRKKIK